MNECPHIPTTHAYHDGELGVDQVQAAQVHIKGCAQCSAELQSLHATRGLFQEAKGAVAQAAVPLEMISRIHRQIDEVGEVRIFRLARRLTAVAAVILVAALVALEVGSSNDGPLSSANSSVATAKPWESLAMMDADNSGTGNDEPAITSFIVRDLSSGISKDSGAKP